MIKLISSQTQLCVFKKTFEFKIFIFKILFKCNNRVFWFDVICAIFGNAERGCTV